MQHGQFRLHSQFQNGIEIIVMDNAKIKASGSDDFYKKVHADCHG